MGNVYYIYGDLYRVIECYECCLKVVNEVGDRIEEGLVYVNFDSVF